MMLHIYRLDSLGNDRGIDDMCNEALIKWQE